MKPSRFPIAAYFGAPGCGKTYAARAALKAVNPSRLFIFDPAGDYADQGREVSTLADLWTHSAPPVFALVFRPSPDMKRARAQFSAFCRVAFERGNALVLVDELADVTSPTSSPPGWGLLIRRGRHKSLQVIACAQRPTEVDSRIFSLATTIRTGRLNARYDRDKLADVLGVDSDEIGALKPRAWIARDMLTGRITRG